jgi:hypothetical protein
VLKVPATEIDPAWGNLQQVEIAFNSHWRHTRVRVASVTPQGASALVAIQSTETSSPWYPHYVSADDPFFVENAYELLDVEGEWYLNTETGTLYYKPRAGEDLPTAEVIAPRLETLVSINGTADQPVHDLVIQGLRFAYTTWLGPSEAGYVNPQAGISYYPGTKAAYVPGMVTLAQADHVVLQGNLFSQGGAHGLVYFAGTSHTEVSGNLFKDLSGGGIVVDPSSAGASHYDLVRDNVIESIGQDYTDVCGILVTYADHLGISHNDLRSLPYTGISVGWNWTDADNPANTIEISGNRIRDVMLEHDDGGGIYTLGKIPQMMISGNFISDLLRSPWAGPYPVSGVYLDNGSTQKTIELNVIDQSDSAFYGYNGPNYANLFQENYYRATSLGQFSEGNTVVNNVSLAAGTAFPTSAQAIVDAAGIEPDFLSMVPTASQSR